MPENKTKDKKNNVGEVPSPTHWAALFPKIPFWLLAIALATFALILMERLYISRAPMTLFGATFGPTEPGELIAPSGAILIWRGREAQIPRGWSPCDGTKGTPDLDERFLMGVVAQNRIGETGGSADIPLAGEHKHAGTTEKTDLPDHNIPCSGHCAPRTSNHVHKFTTDNAGMHTHGDNRPPYYAVMLLCRI